MKKSILITKIIFCMVFCQNAFAQVNLDLSWGKEQEAEPKFSFISDIIGGNTSYVYALKVKTRGRGTHYYLDRYVNPGFELNYTKELIFPEHNGKEAKFEKMIFLKGKLVLFTSVYDKDNDKNIAFMQKVSEAGDIEAGVQEIDAIDATKKRNAGNFDFVVSEDKTRILVYHNEPYEKNANQKIAYKVIDENLKVMWEKKLELPYTDKQFKVNNYRVDNDGNVFMLAEIDKNKEDKERGKPNYSFSILAYFYKESSLKEYSIDLGNKYISDINFNLSPTGDIVCGGFYSNTSAATQAGTFYLKIDRTTKAIVTRNLKEFPKDFLLQFMTEKKMKKGNVLFRFNIDHLILHEDGSALMVGEQAYLEVVCSYNSQTHSQTCTYHYYYNDIIVVNFNEKGEQKRLDKIRKYQHTVNDGGPYSSYVLIENKGKLHFIFNDNAKNVKLTDAEIKDPKKYKAMNRPAKSVAMLVSLFPDGKQNRTPLLENKEMNSYVMPKMYEKIGEKEVIIFARRGRFYKFGKVKI